VALFTFDTFCNRLAGPRENAHEIFFKDKYRCLQRVAYPDVGTTGLAVWRKLLGYQAVPKEDRLIMRTAQRFADQAYKHHARAEEL